MSNFTNKKEGIRYDGGQNCSRMMDMGERPRYEGPTEDKKLLNWKYFGWS